MRAILWLVAVGAVVHGIIAGLSFDVAAVKLPTRRRIGVVPYANFARGNDLGNGIVVYPAMGVLAIVLVFGTTLWAYFAHAPGAVILPMLAACVGTIAHSLGTVAAAPIMLSLKTTQDDENVLAKKLDRFAAWHTFRTVFQFLTFVALIWALVEASRVFP